ncbi:hypothetical protein CGC20_30590 [Leishmania donovani]|uniref:Uncharacterized protein n=1 Tax=Leishmania donovani TaxID=5661 RepID=A0A504XW12_LEIDO|nr:hypothetical protein CGC20_30590 [Leishmania donovani]
MSPYIFIFSELKHNESRGRRRFASTLGTSAEAESIRRAHELSESDILCPTATALTPVLHDNGTYLLLGGKHEDDIKVLGTVCEYVAKPTASLRLLCKVQEQRQFVCS